MKIAKIACTAAGTAWFAWTIPAMGHHSMSEYDRSVIQELEGEVVEVSWRNPHVLLRVSATDENGAQATWELEGAAVSAQRRRGVTEGVVEVGQRVRVAGWPSTQRAMHMQVINVLLPDGLEILMGGPREPRWSENTIGGDPWSVDEATAAMAQGQGIFRVWSQGTRAWYFSDSSGYRLTPSAAAASAQWNDLEDNPLMDCIPPGMPGLMGNPYPVEFVEGDGFIEMRFEEFDVVRTIRLEAADADEAPASPLGYSVGRWEDDTLVVTTNRINWPYFDRIGAPQSEAVVVQERFQVVDDGERLDYVMTVTDPATLLEPFVWESHWVWKRGEEVHRYDCTLEG